MDSDRDIFVGILIFVVLSLGALLVCLLCLISSVWIIFYCKFKRKEIFGELLIRHFLILTSGIEFLILNDFFQRGKTKSEILNNATQFVSHLIHCSGLYSVERSPLL